MPFGYGNVALQAIQFTILNGNQLQMQNTNTGGTQIFTVSSFPGTTIPTNTWVHIGVMRSSSLIYFLYNGTVSASAGSVAGLTFNGGKQVRLGHSSQLNGGDYPFSGKISNFRISNVARYPTGSAYTPVNGYSNDSTTQFLTYNNYSERGVSSVTSTQQGSVPQTYR